MIVESAKVSKGVNSVFVTRDRALIVYRDYCIINVIIVEMFSKRSRYGTIKLEDRGNFSNRNTVLILQGKKKKDKYLAFI